jgi:predicted LPLAT superfamily acyltransferase
VDSIKNDQGEASLITVRQYLSHQQHVGFLADRALEGQVELILFLGKLAPFETRPFRVAAACQAPMIYTYNFKVGVGKYRFITAGPCHLKFSGEEDRRLQTYRWTEQFVRDLEEKVKVYPHQWFNFYPFWSSLPKPIQSEGSQRSDNYLVEELRTPTTAELGQESGKTPTS